MCIQKASWESTPQFQGKSQNRANYPPEVKELITKKRKNQKSWQRVCTAENKRKVNLLCNDLLKELIRKVINESVGTFVGGLTAQMDMDYLLWKVTKGLKRLKIQLSPLRQEDRSWARSRKEKADLFMGHLEENFHPLPRQTAQESNIFVPKRCV